MLNSIAIDLQLYKIFKLCESHFLGHIVYHSDFTVASKHGLSPEFKTKVCLGIGLKSDFRVQNKYRFKTQV